MYCRLLAVLVILYILVQLPVLVDREDIAMPSMLVEGVAINAVRWFLRSQNKDRSCSRIGAGCERMVAHGMGYIMTYVCRAFDCVAGPFFHRRAIDVLLGMVKRDP